MSSTFNFNSFLETIKPQIVDLAKQLFTEMAHNLTTEAITFTTQTQQSIEQWAIAYLQGQLTNAELNDLLMGQTDLLKIKALKHKGLATIQTDKFKQGVCDIIASGLKKAL